ncbi:hypothetical protein BCV70DRAFT_95979 [Testicularia cyperi]|uniref:P-loop containing nucleoside triphosphate hydrolase protein n=1 Tax=Testicularia cyperi TaxID=1882483 RepID=A0A317XQ78_9BASI|nr:hypothetical protein BCV70DRAFT_95979 [Testicularia cyperi]
MTADAPTPIVIWVHPRSCSTAFERSLMQRPDTLVYHEPIGDPFYYGKDRPCKRFSDEQSQASGNYDLTVSKVLEGMVNPSKEDLAKHKTWPPKYVFIKDMGQCLFKADLLHQLHPESKVFPGATDAATGSGSTSKYDPAAPVVENPTTVPTAILKRFKHTFLIRTPEKSIPSYYKCVQEGASGWEFWDPADAGYVELKILYDWIANPESTFNTEKGDEYEVEQPQPPPLLDASTLLNYPGHAIKSYCEAVGIQFSQDMLSWDSGPVDEWAKWGGYHNAAENSTGFKKETKANVPEHLQGAVDDCLEPYTYLLHKATIKAPNGAQAQ